VAEQHVGVGDLEVVAAELALVLLVDVAVGDDRSLPSGSVQRDQTMS